MKLAMNELDESTKKLPEVQIVNKLGYEISYHFHEKRPTLYFKVVFKGSAAAFATFRFDKTRKIQFTQTIIVVESHRRRGIANALMICSIMLTGCRPIPTASLSPDARAWWAQPNRPW
jgi:hypothetical protein